MSEGQNDEQAYVEQRERDLQPAYLCTMTMQDNVDSKGVARYPVGSWHIEEGRTLTMEYFCEHYPLKVEPVGYRALFDPQNERMKS